MSALAEIKFDCPECGEGLAIDRRAIGHQVACPFCKDPITVPEIEMPPEIPVEPIQQRSPSLEELASSRPEIPEVGAKSPPASGNSDTASPEPSEEAEQKNGGLPPKRKPGEKPKMTAEAQGAGPAAPHAPPNSNRQAVAVPPAAARQPQAPLGQEPSNSPAGKGGERRRRAGTDPSAAPEGFEERVRRKRKRRDPDEHRLNPREHPQMVAFDEAIGDNTFRKHPGHGKMPFWKRLGVVGAILGIIAAIGLGVLKQMQLNAPDEKVKPRELGPLEKEFEAAKKRLDAFRHANSVKDKMSYLRVPITSLEGYPSLMERMSTYYNKYTLRPHFPVLDRASTQLLEQGDTDFLRITMENNKGVESYVYFEKAVAGYSLDWDSFVGYNPQSWTEFLVNPSETSEAGIFRLILTPTDHYTGLYQNKEKYRSFLVTNVASAMNAVAYVVRDTPAEKGIDAEFKKLKMRDKKRIQIIAKVNLVERGLDGSNHVQIEKLLRNSWLLP